MATGYVNGLAASVASGGHGEEGLRYLAATTRGL